MSLIHALLFRKPQRGERQPCGNIGICFLSLLYNGAWLLDSDKVSHNSQLPRACRGTRKPCRKSRSISPPLKTILSNPCSNKRSPYLRLRRTQASQPFQNPQDSVHWFSPAYYDGLSPSYSLTSGCPYPRAIPRTVTAAVVLTTSASGSGETHFSNGPFGQMGKEAYSDA